MKKVAVHGKEFHADDVFAIAILRLIYPKVKVIRTRDIEKLKKVDARIDVGRRYNPKTNDFDHHQPKGAGERKNRIPYASAGLIWKHFGQKLVSSKEVFEYIDNKIIKYVDANDVGLKTYKSEKLEPYTISDFVSGLNPPWPNQTEEQYNKNFEEAVSFIIKLLEREIKLAEGIIESKKIIKDKIKKSNGDYLIMEKYIPWRQTVIKESKLKYVVFYDGFEDHWCVVAVPAKLNSFENRKNLPKAWAGLADEELQKVTGVKDAIFCHNKLFIAISKTKEGAIKLVKMALENKN